MGDRGLRALKGNGNGRDLSGSATAGSVPPVTKLLRACVALGYIPQQWRITRVVFIPKPGRIDYDQAGAYRPISPTSFMSKTLERLVDRHVRDGPLRIRPLHTLQFVYQANKSTETALHRLLHRLENARKKDCLPVGLFFDIEEAFKDHTSAIAENLGDFREYFGRKVLN